MKRHLHLRTRLTPAKQSADAKLAVLAILIVPAALMSQPAASMGLVRLAVPGATPPFVIQADVADHADDFADARADAEANAEASRAEAEASVADSRSEAEATFEAERDARAAERDAARAEAEAWYEENAGNR